MEIGLTKYADGARVEMNTYPVGIITCNRIDHLRECIESLQKNSLAKYTELFISVDCPPSDKYLDGYNKVVEYLDSGIDGFKDVYIFKQEKNLGHELNCYWLEDKVFEKYDAFIYTEDDNVFSANFLEYCNKCLEEHKDDNKCYGICGHLYPVDFRYGNNNVVKMFNDFDAWGYGIYKNKVLDARKYILSEAFTNARKNPDLMRKLLHKNAKLFCYYVENLYRNIKVMKSDTGITRMFDITIAIYCIFYDMYNVVPIESKSRNNGWDGSGFNCPPGTDKYRWADQPIDKSERFEYHFNSNDDNKDYNIKTMKDYHHVKLHRVIKRVVMLWLYNFRHK